MAVQGYTVLRFNPEKRVQLDGITNAERAFVFKLFLCNPFARSAGIFYALLCQLSSLQFTPFTIYSVQGYTIFHRSTAD